MSNEQLRRIAIGLVVLVVLWLGLKVIRGQGRDTELTLPRVAFDPASVDTVILTRPADTVRLVKGAAGWTVNGYPASPTGVQEFLAAVTDTAATSELVAESPSSHASLGVDTASARRLVIRRGADTVLSLLVGKRGANWESAYVRRPGMPRVFQVRGRLVEFVERRVDDWRDKRIVHVDPDSLERVAITHGPMHYVLTRKDSVTWTFEDGTATDSSRVATLVDKFKELSGNGFARAGQIDSANFASPGLTIQLVAKSGTPTTLRFDSTATAFLVRRDSLPTVYTLPTYQVGELAPADATLKKAPPAQ